VKNTMTTAVVACLSITACLVAYVTKGAVPDVLTVLATTSVGGFLGVSIPNTK
jgi:hypothetical protein